VRLYLQDIGRVDMLSQEEELLLARQVQAAELPILQTMVLHKLRQPARRGWIHDYLASLDG
jgi:hypothetical protein